MSSHTRSPIVTFLLVICLLSLAPVSAGAATINFGYVDLAAWQAAVDSLYGTVNFEECWSPFGECYYNSATGFSYTGSGGTVQFVGVKGSNYELSIVNPANKSQYNYNSSQLLAGPTLASDLLANFIQINLPANTTAVSMDLMSLNPGFDTTGHPIRVCLLDGAVCTNIATVNTSNRPQRKFFGFTSDVPMASLRLYLQPLNNTNDPNNAKVLLDNFQYGLAKINTGSGSSGSSETAEITTLLYVGTGVFLIWARLRRRQMVRFPF